MNPNRRQLLQELLQQKDKFISGGDLSKRLNISRTAIWKHMQELQKEGFEFEAVRKQGYRLLKEPPKLSVSTLLPYMTTKWLGQHIHVHETVGSTQAEAHRLAGEGSPSGTVVLAEQQIEGKGRLGRIWHSPSGTGIWMSFIVRPDLTLSKVPQLTLLSAVAVRRALGQITQLDLEIKWPNDLLIKGRKAAGILTELNAEADRVNYVVLGIGINVNQKKDDFPSELQNVATSLAVETSTPIDRKSCIIHILKEWEDLYELYVQKGFSPIKTLWETYSFSLGKPVVARTMEGRFEGIATGITNEGTLLLEEANGNIRKIYSADLQT